MNLSVPLFETHFSARAGADARVSRKPEREARGDRMERTCAPSRLSIRLTIDSEGFRELTDTNDLPSTLQKKLDQITAHHLYTGFPCILRSLKQSIHGAHGESSRFSNPQECASVNP